MEIARTATTHNSDILAAVYKPPRASWPNPALAEIMKVLSPVTPVILNNSSNAHVFFAFLAKASNLEQTKSCYFITTSRKSYC
jgi:hypothetical protein